MGKRRFLGESLSGTGNEYADCNQSYRNEVVYGVQLAVERTITNSLDSTESVYISFNKVVVCKAYALRSPP